MLTEINKNAYLACLLPEFIMLYNLSFDILNLSYDTLLQLELGVFFMLLGDKTFYIQHHNYI